MAPSRREQGLTEPVDDPVWPPSCKHRGTRPGAGRPGSVEQTWFHKQPDLPRFPCDKNRTLNRRERMREPALLSECQRFQYPAMVAAVVSLHEGLRSGHPDLRIERSSKGEVGVADDGVTNVGSARVPVRLGPEALGDVYLGNGLRFFYPLAREDVRPEVVGWGEKMA